MDRYVNIVIAYHSVKKAIYETRNIHIYPSIERNLNNPIDLKRTLLYFAFFSIVLCIER